MNSKIFVEICRGYSFQDLRLESLKAKRRIPMKRNRLFAGEWVKRVVLALLFISVGSFIMLIFYPWGKGPKLNPVDDYLTKIASAFLSW
jgi:hypothetical protein